MTKLIVIAHRHQPSYRMSTQSHNPTQHIKQHVKQLVYKLEPTGVYSYWIYALLQGTDLFTIRASSI
jgi:hypothetical protein